MITSLQLMKAIIGFLASFGLAVIVIPMVIKWVKKNHLMDNPNERASHFTPTPTLGGIGFMPGIMLGILLLPFNWEIGAILLSAITLFVTGLLDDTRDLKASKKLLIQLSVGAILFASGLQFNSFHGILGITDFHWLISMAITIFFFAGIINSFNLIDGIDGLAAGIGFINSMVFGITFFFLGDIYYAILALAFGGALLGFLMFNFNPAKIFMGDTGSLLLGLFMSVFFLKAFSYGNNTATMVAFATILFPAIDMCRLFITRMINKTSPFKADKNHYHHLLIKAGDNHRKAALICYGLKIAYIITAVGFSFIMGLTMAVVVFHVLSILLYVLIDVRFYYLAKKQKKDLQNSFNKVVDKNNLLKTLIS